MDTNTKIQTFLEVVILKSSRRGAVTIENMAYDIKVMCPRGGVAVVTKMLTIEWRASAGSFQYCPFEIDNAIFRCCGGAVRS